MRKHAMTSEQNISESGLMLSGTDLIMSRDFTSLERLWSSPKGYAEIYRAQRMGKWHVLKCLKPECSGQTLYLGLLQKEFDICYHLSHPNVVQVIGLENVPPLGPCIVMEYIEGCTLRKAIGDKTLTKTEVKSVVSQLCDALDYIHSQQIIHRDLKPENVMLTSNGLHVKIIDFGYSDADNYAVLKQPAGTRIYAAPELKADKPIDARADLYSLGVIICEIERSLPHGSFQLRRIAKRCMRETPTERYASATEVGKALVAKRRWPLAACFIAALIAAGVYFGISGKQKSQAVAVNEKADTVYLSRSGGTSETLSTTAKADTTVKKEIVLQPEVIDNFNKDERLAYLVKFAKQKAANLMVTQERKLADSTLSYEERRKYQNFGTLYFDTEKEVKHEIARLVSQDKPEYSIYESAVMNAFLQVVKEYNLAKLRKQKLI